MKKMNKKFWDRYASVYDRVVKADKKGYDKTCREIEHLFWPDMLVLEVACGTGQFTRRLAGNVVEWNATDFSEKMIKQAKKHCKDPNVHFSVADATKLEYASNTFDAVFIGNALQIMPQPDKALREIHRVLRPGGMIIAPTCIEKEVKPKFFGFAKPSKFMIENTWEPWELATYVAKRGFNVESDYVIEGKTMDECIIVGRKKTTKDIAASGVGAAKKGGSTAVKAGKGIFAFIKAGMAGMIKRAAEANAANDEEE